MYVLSRNMKISKVFYLKIFSFLGVKFSIYLNRCVFVMLLSCANVSLSLALGCCTLIIFFSKVIFYHVLICHCYKLCISVC